MALLAPSLAHAQTQPAPTAQPAQPAPGTAANPILVPAGCTASTQASGQVVIVCPRDPATAAPAAPAGPVPVYAPVGSAPPAPPKEERKWYGWQTLIVDGATLVTTIALAAPSPQAANGVFWSGYLLGGPIVHWSNGQLGMGFASLGLRVGAPLVLGLTGAALGGASGNSDWDNFSGAYAGAAIGLLAGYVTAVAVDSAVLARKTVKVTPEAEQKSRLKLKWSPTVGYDPKTKMTSLGVGGTF